eukprot:Skav221083  [mRNA]  locus=scaffold3118:548378:561603:- [translate_table: standard]
MLLIPEAPRSNLPEIEKKKFLVIYLLIDNKVAKTGAPMAETGPPEEYQGESIQQMPDTCQSFLEHDMQMPVRDFRIYDRYKADDGFLYIAYSAENTLG